MRGVRADLSLPAVTTETMIGTVAYLPRLVDDKAAAVLGVLLAVPRVSGAAFLPVKGTT